MRPWRISPPVPTDVDPPCVPMRAVQPAAPGGPNTQPPPATLHLGLGVWVSPSGRGAFHFLDAQAYRVTAGLPRAASADLPALHEEFSAECRRLNLKPLHFGMNDAGLEFLPPPSSTVTNSRWHVGDLPVFNLARWHAGSETLIPSHIRSQCRRARRLGVAVSLWKSAPARPDLDALCAARDTWLRMKALPPLGFMTTPYLFEPWPADGVFVAKVGGRIAGFLVGSRGLFGDLFRVDAVARIPGAPSGTAELLVTEAFRDAAARGIERATLGLAPLARRTKVREVWWLRVVSGCARHLGRGVYSFAGLEAFKAKFQPDAWVPLYAVAPGRRFTPRDVLAVARVFAGGSLVRYIGRFLLYVLKRVFRPAPQDKRALITPNAIRL